MQKHDYDFITDRLAIGNVASRATPGFVAVVSILATDRPGTLACEVTGAPEVPNGVQVQLAWDEDAQDNEARSLGPRQMDAAQPAGVVCPMKCQGFAGPCSADTAEYRPCMTAYHWDGKGENPNPDPILCAECHSEYVRYWQERWDEYYREVY